MCPYSRECVGASEGRSISEGIGVSASCSVSESFNVSEGSPLWHVYSNFLVLARFSRPITQIYEFWADKASYLCYFTQVFG